VVHGVGARLYKALPVVVQPMAVYILSTVWQTALLNAGYLDSSHGEHTIQQKNTTSGATTLTDGWVFQLFRV